jgi:hypothetical protein
VTPLDDLAGALLRHAAGLTSDTAAAELICAHHTWLTRTDFITTCIHAGTRHDGHPYAYIDWERAVAALDTRSLCCSPSEASILRIAASLGDLGSPEPSGLRTSSKVHPERVGCKWPARKRTSRLNSATRLPGRLWITHGPLPRWRAESA